MCLRPYKSKIPEKSQIFQPRWKKRLNFAEVIDRFERSK